MVVKYVISFHTINNSCLVGPTVTIKCVRMVDVAVTNRFTRLFLAYLNCPLGRLCQDGWQDSFIKSIHTAKTSTHTEREQAGQIKCITTNTERWHVCLCKCAIPLGRLKFPFLFPLLIRVSV